MGKLGGEISLEIMRYNHLSNDVVTSDEDWNVLTAHWKSSSFGMKTTRRAFTTMSTFNTLLRYMYLS